MLTEIGDSLQRHLLNSALEFILAWLKLNLNNEGSVFLSPYRRSGQAGISILITTSPFDVHIFNFQIYHIITHVVDVDRASLQGLRWQTAGTAILTRRRFA